MPTDSEGSKRVAAIVPAYNEQETLTDVLSVLKGTSLIDEVLVVSDGSTDQTVEICRTLGVKTLHLHHNRGKGMAMAVGVAHTSAPVLLFVDADILNLSDYLLGQLIEPVVDAEAGMNIGIRNRGALINTLHSITGPLLSGIRCLRREVFEAVPEEYLEGYAIETCLNWSARKLRARIATTVLYDLKHLVKEKKRGFGVGVRARFRMFRVVFVAYLALRWKRPHLRRPGGARLPEPELDYINW